MRTALLLFLPIFAVGGCTQNPSAGPFAPSYPPPRANVSGSPMAWGTVSQALLQAHNSVRYQVGVPPLVWSNQLATVAQGWADHLLATHTFEHSPGNEYGENLFMIRGGSATVFEVVYGWADEAEDYDLRTNTCTTGECGHYTQIVWSTTREVGCAIAADQAEEIWVCEYYPPGNYVGHRPY
jgi:pathogenesis-related protein 1